MIHLIPLKSRRQRMRFRAEHCPVVRRASAINAETPQADGLRTSPHPSIDLYRQVRGAFIAQGKTLQGWCKENGTHLSNARSALTGNWDGPKGREMRRRLVKAAGLQVAA